MRFFHLSDLHIGKQLHHYNLKEDQEFILHQIVEYARQEQPDCIVIAGDIYDKSAPSAEAVAIFDAFLTELSELIPVIPILIISGNHDSAQRLDFASGILKRQSIHLVGMPPVLPEEYIKKVTLADAYGEVDFYLLPFVKPGFIRRVFPDEPIESYDMAVRRLIEREEIDPNRRTVLVSHQFYTAGGQKPIVCDSESVSVGGVDNVDTSAVEIFDYVAAGHIHGTQSVGQPWIRYCGTPLKYSVSESNHHKSITLVTLGEKSVAPVIETLALSALRDVQKVTGSLAEVLDMWEDTQEQCPDYVSITLTDESELYKPKDELSSRFERILEIKANNSRTRSLLGEIEDVRLVTDPLTVFGEFFEEMQGRQMTPEEQDSLQEIIHQSGEEGTH